MPLRPAIATVSLGRSSAGHSLLQKLDEAAKQSFEGVEIFYECLEFLARSRPGGLSHSSLLETAGQVRDKCDQLNLEIICLQPFTFFEGLTCMEARCEVLEKLRFWLKLVKILRTDLIQIPTNFLQNGTSGDLDLIKADLLHAARLGAMESPVVRFAYEAVAWGAHIDTWEASWEIVKEVNMPNFGLCLDTFHIAGRVWADPTSESGKQLKGDQHLAATLNKMVSELDAQKIFYIQGSDAQNFVTLAQSGDVLNDVDQPLRMTWSRNARLFPEETDRGGYLPVELVLDTIIKKVGYCGWVSMEAFSHELFGKDSNLPSLYAKRAWSSWIATRKKYCIEKQEAVNFV